MPPTATASPTPPRVWDLPLRVFHWGLVVCVFGAVGSSKAGMMAVHERFGLAVLGLVVFRLVWGFVGGHHARFASFLLAPHRMLALVRAPRPVTPALGHSPLAGYSVLALLLIAGFMAGSGSLSNDGILFDGPLAHLVPAHSKTITGLHHNAQFVLFALVGLHIGAILFYRLVKKRGLTAAMVHGRAAASPAGAPPPTGPDGGISARRTAAGLVLMATCIGGAQLLPLLRPAW